MINANNGTEKQSSIGGKVLYPGESRPIEDHEVNEARKKGLTVTGTDLPEIKKVEPKPQTLAELQKESIKIILSNLADLTDAEVLELEALEKADDAPRETLLPELEKEIARRSI